MFGVYRCGLVYDVTDYCPGSRGHSRVQVMSADGVYGGWSQGSRGMSLMLYGYSLESRG